jgi:pyruvate kinase
MTWSSESRAGWIWWRSPSCAPPMICSRRRRVIAAAGGDCPLFAKIEKAEALDNLEAIIEEADGILIARGDLGVEIGLHRVPVVQKISSVSRAAGVCR